MTHTDGRHSSEGRRTHTPTHTKRARLMAAFNYVPLVNPWVWRALAALAAAGLAVLTAVSIPEGAWSEALTFLGWVFG